MIKTLLKEKQKKTPPGISAALKTLIPNEQRYLEVRRRQFLDSISLNDLYRGKLDISDQKAWDIKKSVYKDIPQVIENVEKWGNFMQIGLPDYGDKLTPELVDYTEKKLLIDKYPVPLKAAIYDTLMVCWKYGGQLAEIKGHDWVKTTRQNLARQKTTAQR
ncbi:MAG: hypothetical protein LBU87_03460 [Lactobacillales bacterium]|jgi:hypothetical protein|nr:hypothetical protein [Lactobacillales bacterium]